MKPGRIFTFCLSLFLLTMGTLGFAQEVFRARLSPMPTTPQTVTEILGEGEVILTLSDNTLEVSGNFTGMSSIATGAHLHNGPPAQPGPVVHTLEINQATSGEISASLELTDEQVEALQNNALYVQVHSVNNTPGELRGWIFLRSHFDN
ncbi:MAG: CHRD domain-containing protein [Gammaproteobacteria bacterium]|nr:CHRD domain-containing protein [Gammaproteobacteria bacterium]MBU15869.1 CHRD domain-containing protein [Gammaproteobacteria bacterium]|tara:strand:+ start:1834 stop:2280 length:447 start_codon:yes stop_codon:yes gene_type:complete